MKLGDPTLCSPLPLHFQILIFAAKEKAMGKGATEEERRRGQEEEQQTATTTAAEQGLNDHFLKSEHYLIQNSKPQQASSPSSPEEADVKKEKEKKKRKERDNGTPNEIGDSDEEVNLKKNKILNEC